MYSYVSFVVVGIYLYAELTTTYEALDLVECVGLEPTRLSACKANPGALPVPHLIKH